nr:hypothetical protein [Tanacetum cinerariifolium]
MPLIRGTKTRTAPATATSTTPITAPAIRVLIAQGVADALAEQEIQRNTNLNGDGSQGSGSGITRPVPPTRECTYSDFHKCQPLNFNDTEGVVGLTQWFERMETVFYIVGHDVAYGMPWKTIIKIKTVKYCPRSEELALMCGRMFLEESDEVEKYVGGLLNMIQGNVMSARPKTMQEAIELANDSMDQKVRAYAERQAKNKRKFDNNNQA